MFKGFNLSLLTLLNAQKILNFWYILIFSILFEPFTEAVRKIYVFICIGNNLSSN